MHLCNFLAHSDDESSHDDVDDGDSDDNNER